MLSLHHLPKHNTTIDRNAHEVFLPVSQFRLTRDIIQDIFENNITQRSIIYTDGKDFYNSLAEYKNCKVEYLNVVNHIHSVIKNKLAQYREGVTKYINRYTHCLYVCVDL